MYGNRRREFLPEQEIPFFVVVILCCTCVSGLLLAASDEAPPSSPPPSSTVIRFCISRRRCPPPDGVSACQILLHRQIRHPPPDSSPPRASVSAVQVVIHLHRRIHLRRQILLHRQIRISTAGTSRPPLSEFARTAARRFSTASRSLYYRCCRHFRLFLPMTFRFFSKMTCIICSILFCCSLSVSSSRLALTAYDLQDSLRCWQVPSLTVYMPHLRRGTCAVR